MAMDLQSLKILGAAVLVLPAIFFVGLGQALVAPPCSRVVSVVVASALGVGVWGFLTRGFSDTFTLVLVAPAYQYLIFRSMHAVFVSRFRRSPQTAAFNFATGILPDRLFNVVFMILSVLLPLFAVAYFL